VLHVPRAPGKGDRRAEEGALQRGGEEVEHRDPDAVSAARALDDRIPEQQRGEEEHRVLRHVHALVAQRCTVERRQMPEPERTDVQRPRDERQTHRAPDRWQPPSATPPGGDAPARRHVERPQRGQSRIAGEQQRCGHDDEQHVLRHVHGEQRRGHGVNRREQCERQRDDAAAEARDAPARDAAPHRGRVPQAAHAARVPPHGEREPADHGRRERPRRPEIVRLGRATGVRPRATRGRRERDAREHRSAQDED